VVSVVSASVVSVVDVVEGSVVGTAVVSALSDMPTVVLPVVVASGVVVVGESPVVVTTSVVAPSVPPIVPTESSPHAHTSATALIHPMLGLVRISILQRTGRVSCVGAGSRVSVFTSMGPHVLTTIPPQARTA
jgi:hypothetical protein